MSMPRDLLDTWENNWPARDTLTRALATSTDDHSCERVTAIVASTQASSALDAARDNAELVELLTAWQWQAMDAVPRDGAS